MTEQVDRQKVFGETAEAAERIAPGFTSEDETAEHIARYRWAAGRVAGRVIDVACGVGYGAPVLRTGGAAEVISVDLSLDALQFGQHRYGLQGVRAEAARVPFPSTSFDSAVSLETIEHLEEPDRLLADLARVLRPGGVLTVSCPNIELSKGNNPYHFSEMTERQLTDRLASAGFNVVAIRGQHWDVLAGTLWRIRGVARVVRAIDRSTRVGRAYLPMSAPKVFCVEARRRPE